MEFSAPTFFFLSLFFQKKPRCLNLFFTHSKKALQFSALASKISPEKKNFFIKDALKNVLIHSYASLTAGSVTFAKKTLNG